VTAESSLWGRAHWG